MNGFYKSIKISSIDKKLTHTHKVVDSNMIVNVKTSLGAQ